MSWRDSLLYIVNTGYDYTASHTLVHEISSMAIEFLTIRLSHTFVLCLHEFKFAILIRDSLYILVCGRRYL